MTVAITGVLIVYGVLVATLLRLGKPWVNPIFLVLLYYLFNYPVRAFLLHEYPDQFNNYSFTDGEILAGLGYSTCYVLIFVVAYLLLLKRFRIRFDLSSLREGPLDSRLFFLTALSVLLSGAVTLGYEVSVGGSFSLGSDIEELRRPFWVNASALPYSLKWFAICMGLLLWLKSRGLAVALATLLVFTIVLTEAFLSTAKGIIAVFLLLFLFLDNLITGKIFRTSVLALGTIVMIVFATYSYYARDAGGTGLESARDYFNFLTEFLGEDLWSVVEARLENVVERGTYYLDALLLMSRADTSTLSEVYAFGSLVEIANLVPRVFGILPDQYSFDRYVTFAVWGEQSFSEIFVGRIGESFFVLGFAGVVYAVIHSGIFAFVASMWTRLSKDLGGIALYFAILVGWLYQDASLMYQFKNLIAVVLGYVLLKSVVRLMSRGTDAPALQSS